ncbi:MAG: hypothetical protein M1834_005667 [Cirrosporium novae-zelandiae]|nr:MAG: hypothetical protein M1834_005667 [Cirrosporium novae-zelandiae]
MASNSESGDVTNGHGRVNADAVNLDGEKDPQAVRELGRLTDNTSTIEGFAGYMKHLNNVLSHHNVEARGIQRVPTSERIERLRWTNIVQMFLLWFSVNLAANNITLGMLGPAVYALSFKDSALTSVFGALVGSIPVAYLATFGPLSGNRTMIFARYTMGWWPSRLIAVLNIIVSIGYALIDCVIAGQILSAVSPHGSLSIVVGIIIVAVITWVVTSFGIRIFHHYERWAFLPQLIAIIIAFSVTAKHYTLTTPSSGSPATVTGNRISFFSLCLSAAITYSGAACDYFVYYPPQTPRIILFTLILLSLTCSFTLTFLLGIGLASALPTLTTWSTAYNTSQGALLVTSLTSSPLHHAFGSFISILVALGLIANLIPPTYSSALNLQILSPTLALVPRVFWNTLCVITYTACALTGRNYLASIFTNFLALMGYWVAIWVSITLEEHLLFRRSSHINFRSESSLAGPYNWEVWNQREKLPVGIAALMAFLVGWVGAVLCMAQVWYVGPIAGLVGEFGADLGNYVGFLWAGVVYPVLRYWEIKRFGR